MKRSVLAAACAAALLPAVTAAAPAQAAGSCTVSVPSKVTITSPYREISVRYGSGCAYAEWASWDVVHPTQGVEDYLIYEAGDGFSDYMDWYDLSPLGKYTVRADDAYDSDDDDIAQNSPTMDVRLGSRVISTAGTRSGSYVTLSGTTQRYSPSYGTYRNWANAKVGVYTKSCSSCSWTWVKTTYASSSGKVSVKVYASTKRYFRLKTSTTSNTWEKSGASIYR